MKKVIKAPAKINLTLDVLHKRSDGYHEVEMIMTTIDLSDRIHLSAIPEKKILIDSNAGFIPRNRSNLAYQAAELLMNRVMIDGGVSIYIEKIIPVSAGLAGGSTDAAAVLRGMNDLWNLGLSISELAKLGEEIGSDVPFCVHGGTAIARGRGEKLTFLPAPPPCWVVLAKPERGVSTKDIYQKLEIESMDHPNTEMMVEAIESRDFSNVCSNLSNVMEAATFELEPEVKFIKKRMIQFGAEGTVMSGSGPTVYSLASSEAKAERLFNGLKGFMDQVFLVRLLGNPHTLD